MSFSAQISIITPVYNTPPVYLEELYNSVKGQTLGYAEWILVNDGSDDTTLLQLLTELEKRDVRIKVVHHAANKGLPAARNTGIDNSTCQHLFFIDADDLIDATLLEKSFLFLQLNGEFSFVNTYVTGFGAFEYKWKGGFYEGELFLKENRNTSCFMARREAVEALHFNESMRSGAEDWDFWLHAASKGLWGFTIPEFLFFYRRTTTTKWDALKSKEVLHKLQQQLHLKYEPLLKNNFPAPQLTAHSFGKAAPNVKIHTEDQEAGNQHLLCIFPWLEVGGADQFNINLLKGLKEKGWQITIVTTETDSEHTWQEKFKAITNDIFHLASLSTPYFFYSTIEHLIESRQPKVVFLSNSMYGYHLLPYLNQRFPKLPITDYLHCEDENWYNGGFPYFSAINTKFLSKTFATSGHLVDWCIGAGAESKKIEACYINVDIQKIKREESVRERIRQQLAIEGNTPVLLYVARLTEQKQPKVLVKTLAKLKARNLLFKCIIIGDGPDKGILLSEIGKRDLKDFVIYLGAQSNEAVMQYMDAADIFFLPSLYEGIALSIYEAMAKSLAIIGAKVGGQAELVTEDTGVLISRTETADEADSYADVLSKLLKQPDEIKKLGMHARKRVEKHFPIEKMIDQLHNEFLKAEPVKPPTPGDMQNAYLHVLNQAIQLKNENDFLKTKINSKASKLLMKVEAKSLYLRKYYQSLRQLLKRDQA